MGDGWMDGSVCWTGVVPTMEGGAGTGVGKARASFCCVVRGDGRVLVCRVLRSARCQPESGSVTPAAAWLPCPAALLCSALLCSALLCSARRVFLRARKATGVSGDAAVWMAGLRVVGARS